MSKKAVLFLMILAIIIPLGDARSWSAQSSQEQPGPIKEERPFTLRDGVSLRDFFEVRVCAMEKAVEVARLDMERRMKDFPEQFVKKGEVGEILSKLTSKVELLEKANNQLEGKASSQALEIVRWVSITGIVLSIIGILLRFFKI